MSSLPLKKSMPSNSPIGLSPTVAIRARQKLRITFFKIENRGLCQVMSKTGRWPTRVRPFPDLDRPKAIWSIRPDVVDRSEGLLELAIRGRQAFAYAHVAPRRRAGRRNPPEGAATEIV
jgi:hypothetical protein